MLCTLFLARIVPLWPALHSLRPEVSCGSCMSSSCGHSSWLAVHSLSALYPYLLFVILITNLYDLVEHLTETESWTICIESMLGERKEMALWSWTILLFHLSWLNHHWWVGALCGWVLYSVDKERAFEDKHRRPPLYWTIKLEIRMTVLGIRNCDLSLCWIPIENFGFLSPFAGRLMVLLDL